MPNKFSKAVYRHPDKPGEGAKKRKGLSAKDKTHAVMGEFKRGTLRSGGSGKHVKSRNWAIEIALSEAGRSKKRRQGESDMAKKSGKKGGKMGGKKGGKGC